MARKRESNIYAFTVLSIWNTELVYVSRYYSVPLLHLRLLPRKSQHCGRVLLKSIGNQYKSARKIREIRVTIKTKLFSF